MIENNEWIYLVEASFSKVGTGIWDCACSCCEEISTSVDNRLVAPVGDDFILFLFGSDCLALSTKNASPIQ